MAAVAQPLEPASYLGECATSGGGARNVVLTGATTHCHVPKFADPISIKTVIHGEVEWRLGKQRYLIRPDTLLLLPAGDEYSLTIDSAAPSRGFNVLFRRGLVEESCRSALASDEALLDAPEELAPLSFGRRLESRAGRLGWALDALVAAVAAGASGERVAWIFEALGARVAEAACEQRRERRRLTAVRAGTRAEIHRRLQLAREAIEDDLAAPWTLVTMARAGMMAPHHFHRCFHLAFGETPRKWLARRRAERALALLRYTRSSVTDVCLQVGYASAGSFSTSFAARYGVPPSRIAGGRARLRGRG